MAKYNVFLDTTIIIDLLADRKPFSNASYAIFRDAKLKKYKLYTSSNSLITTYYILAKNISSSDANRAIETILSRVEFRQKRPKDCPKV